MNNAMSAAGRSGGRVILITQVLRMVITVVSLAVLSRLVEPAHFGIIAMVMAFIGVGDIIRDLGLAGASIQARSINQAQRSNLFWLNTAVGATFSLSCALLAPAFAAYYGEPAVAAVTIWLAWVFLLNGVQTQAQADLTRSFKFRALSLSELGATLAGVVVAIACAAYGMGLWALVAQHLVQAVVRCVSRLLLSGWVPSLPKRRAGMRSLLRFGFYTTLAQLVLYAGNNFHTWFLGRLATADTLGHYTRAQQIYMVPTLQLLNPLTSVAHSTMSRMQDDLTSIARSVERLTPVLGYPVAICCAVFIGAPNDTILVLLGPGWDLAPQVLAALAAGGVVLGINRSVTWTFAALGLTREFFHTVVLTRTIIIGLMVGGYLSFGVVGVALGHSLGIVISWPLNAFALAKHVPVRAAYWAASMRVVFLAIAVGATVWIVVTNLSDGLEPMMRLSVGAFFAIGICGLLALLPSYRRDFMATIQVLRR